MVKSKINILFHFLLIGSFAGFIVSAATTLSGMIVWLHFDQADFYYRGWYGIQISFIMGAILNGIVGIISGGIIISIEQFLRKKIKTQLFLTILPIIFMAVYIPLIYIQFERHTIFQPVFLEQILFVIVSIFLGMFLLKADTKH